MIYYPKKLNAIFKKLESLNAVPIIIGGYVRDWLLKIESKDIDIEIYNISSYTKLEHILKEFGSVNSVGRSFGVCKLTMDDLEVDFTLPRVESKVSSGHKGFKVEVKESIDFYTATKRRDFTINSIGYDALNKKLLDPFNGVNDLKTKTLRATSKNTFVDDPLRALRAIQFSARFNLSPDNELKSMILNMMENNLLKEIARERIFIEFEKLLLKSSKPSIGFKLLKELNILDNFIELKNISNTIKYEELLYSIDEMAKLKNDDKSRNIILMFCVITYYIEDVELFLLRFTNDKYLLNSVLDVQKYKNIGENDFNSYYLAKLATHINLNMLFDFLYIVRNKERKFIISLEGAKRLALELHILNEAIPPLLKGRDILQFGISPSKEFKTILDKAYDIQLRGEITNHKQAIVWLKEYLSL